MYLTAEDFVLDSISGNSHVSQDRPCSRYVKFNLWISQFIRVLGIWLYYSGSLIQNYFKFKVCDWPIWKDIVKNSPKSLTIMSNTGTPWNTLSVAQAVTLCENP